MLRKIIAVAMLAALFNTPAAAQANPPPAADVRFAVVRTGQLRVKEALVFSGGRFGKELVNNFSAFLVKHNDTHFLFDSGLGRRVAAQYQQDMPLWSRPFFNYEDPVLPAEQQLRTAGFKPIERIVLSHAHWDHASGLEDFPQAEVWAAEEELAVVRKPSSGVGGAWPSQMVKTPPLRWKALQFQPVAYEGYERSLDMFGDGSAVLVPMFGHTPGSVGLFLKLSSGHRYFFVGDVVWSAGALREGRPKQWVARQLVDHHGEQTQAAIEQIRAVMKRNPAMVIVPSHDGEVHDALGYFPAWARAGASGAQ